MSVQRLAVNVLNATEPTDKVAAAQKLARQWQTGNLPVCDKDILQVPDTPNRPARPELVAPKYVKRRRLGSPEGRAALMHAIAHIELNAIDLAADLLARFGNSDRMDDKKRHGFIDDWVQVCADEARHFTMINTRLTQLGSFYGALPAHNGLWEAAQSTAQDLAARLVIAPMVLEARGLDVTPGMIDKLKSVGDDKSAAILQIIYNEEIPHVAAGTRWFLHICKRENTDPEARFKSLLKTYYKGILKPPFNDYARALAGMPAGFYKASLQ